MDVLQFDVWIQKYFMRMIEILLNHESISI